MIDWVAFLVVLVSALVAASLLVTLFSLALRFSDGASPRRRNISRLMYVLCALAALAGVLVIVLHARL